MSVIITDMDMPKTCHDCRFCVVDVLRVDPLYRCMLIGKIIDEHTARTYKLPDEICPLREEPVYRVMPRRKS